MLALYRAGRQAEARVAQARGEADAARVQAQAEAEIQRVNAAANADAIRLNANASTYADYFERCRRKRNVIDYTRSHVATETEAKEIVKKATEFYDVVEQWIDSKFANLKR